MISSRTLRRRLTLTLMAVAFVSILLVGFLNFVAARELLDTGARDRLSSTGLARARSIENGAEQLRGRVSVVAADLALVEAMEDLVNSYSQLSQELTSAQESEMEDWYRSEVVTPIEAAGLGPVTIEELVPMSSPGRYVQYHFVVAPRAAGDEGRDVADPGDDSLYSSAHARHHPYLTELADRLTGGDLMLVSTDGDVVYSVDKRIDLGTNLDVGPYRDTTLASAVREQLGRAAAGETIVGDWQLYLPARGRPTLFLAAALRRETAVIGALVVEVPSAGLSTITTANQEWDAVGLPEGESYVVGPDMVLRSESRSWIEDPARYLDRVDDEALARLIETFGSPVGLQPVETEAVSAALDGEVFEGQATNYLGEATFSSAVPIDVPGVDWVVVVDTPLGEARSGLYDYLIRLGILLLVMLPVAGLLGFLLADRLARPIPPVVRAARAVADGERSPDLQASGADELGDLGRRLLRTAAELGRQEQALEAEFEHKRRLLLSVLPARLVSPEGDVGDGTEEAIETTTAVAVGFDVTSDNATSADGSQLSEVLAEVAELADARASRRGIDRIRSAADRHLFLAGSGAVDEGANEAVAFAAEIATESKQLAERAHVHLAVHIGLSSGPVATGVLDQGSLTFGAWGEPVRRALAIGALSRADEILVDRSTAAALDDDRFDLGPASDVINLDGTPMQLVVLRTDSTDTVARSRSSPG